MIRRWLRRRRSSAALRHLVLPRDGFRAAVAREPSRLALVAPRGSLTYGELGSRVRRLAAALDARGVGRGSAVFAQLRDDWEQVELRLAAQEIGALFAGFSPADATDLVARAAAAARPRVFVYDPSFAAGTARRFAEAGEPYGLIAVGGEYERWLQRAADHQPGADVAPEDPAVLALTAGTGGAPAMVCLDQADLLHGARVFAGMAGFEPDPVLLSGVPLGAPGAGTLLAAVLCGGTLVLADSRAADGLLPLVARHGVTRMLVTSSQLVDVLDSDELDAADLASLRGVVYGSAPMPAAKLEDALLLFGPMLTQVYALAECAAPIASLPAAMHVSGSRPAPRCVLTSAGQVPRGAGVRVHGADGHDLPAGTPGELLVRLPDCFPGYWHDPDLARERVIDGYLRTGDLGTLDGRGGFQVLGRCDEVIERPGCRIVPRLVEEMVHDHPAVKEAALAQPRRGGEVVLCVSLRRALRDRRDRIERSLEAFCRERIATPEQPDRIEIVDELPRSAAGKVSRRELAEALAAVSAAPIPT
ncbi:MAG: AMP-binding protein [Acidobacteria bacterium]|nr:AMP-binding protein [Acidobacteriota bacterium]